MMLPFLLQPRSWVLTPEIDLPGMRRLLRTAVLWQLNLPGSG